MPAVTGKHIQMRTVVVNKWTTQLRTYLVIYLPQSVVGMRRWLENRGSATTAGRIIRLRGINSILRSSVSCIHSSLQQNRKDSLHPSSPSRNTFPPPHLPTLHYLQAALPTGASAADRRLRRPRNFMTASARIYLWNENKVFVLRELAMRTRIWTRRRIGRNSIWISCRLKELNSMEIIPLTQQQ